LLPKQKQRLCEGGGRSCGDQSAVERSEAEAAASAAVEASIKSIIIDNGEFVEIMCGWD